MSAEKTLFRAASTKPTAVYSIDELLAYRDTWLNPLDDFDLDEKLKPADKPKALETSENGFRAGAAADLSDTDKLVRQVQATLNKLTAETFDVLVTPLLVPALFEPGVANTAVEKIFDKSLEEPKYAHLYANMCYRMAEYEHSYLEQSKKVRVSIVERAQTVYESTMRGDGIDPEKLRKRKLANIKFVGHLYKQNLLAQKIPRVIVSTIFKDKVPPEVDLEVTITLLDQVGHLLDGDGKQLDEVIARLRELSTEESYSQRLRFLVMNLVDLRDKLKWVRPEIRSGDSAPTGSSESAGASSAAKAGAGAAASLERRPPLPPDMTSQQQLTAVRTIIGMTKENASEGIKTLSTLLKDQNLSVNRAAALCYAFDAACLSSKDEQRRMISDTIALGTFDKQEVRAGLSWAVANAITALSHEDCPKYHERLADLLLQLATDKKEHKAVVREVLSTATEHIDEVYAEMEGSVQWDEAFHALWTEFIKQSVGRREATSGSTASLAEVLDALAAFKRTGLAGRVMTDLISALADSKYCTYDDLAAWHASHKANAKFAHIVDAMALLV